MRKTSVGLYDKVVIGNPKREKIEIKEILREVPSKFKMI